MNILAISFKNNKEFSQTFDKQSTIAKPSAMLLDNKTGKLVTTEEVDKKYKNRGYTLQDKNEKRKFKVADALFATLGATLGVTKAIKGNKIKLPIMSFGYFDAKVPNDIVNGLGNALLYTLGGQFILAVVEKSQNKSK